MTSALDAASSFILTLGRRLVAADLRSELYDELPAHLPETEATASEDFGGLLRHQANKAREAADDEVNAIEDLILATKASTLPEAVVQIMVSRHRLGLISGRAPGQTEPEELQEVERALWSALKVCAASCGLQLAEVGGRSHASAMSDMWPEPDASSLVRGELPPGYALACDEALPGEAL